jgi:ubiquinone/menaquinone biosynthesis C-methylase UbiE
MELVAWIEKRLMPESVNSIDFMYDEMESQSGQCLPIIYQPFSAGKRSHWRDRGSLYDFLYALNCEHKRILDFGPGDGWPSLIIAPFVREVIGVDGSRRRVAVCEENAKRLGVGNARFIQAVPGHALPFDDESFDGIVAASSVEQTPDPRSALREFHRLLKPGGRVRVDYEALSRYRNGKERELFFDSDEKGNCMLTIYDRHIAEERADMYRLIFSKACREVFPVLPTIHTLSTEKLSRLTALLSDAKKCTLTHPCGETLAHWMEEIGFGEVIPSHSGAWIAGKIYDAIPGQKRPKGIEGVDKLIRPVIRAVVEMRAPLANDPLVTAVK